MKTLVAPRHGTTRETNGVGDCYARAGNDGLCPGVAAATWLNGLGDDDEQFGFLKRVTNGQVRDKWLASYSHIVAVEPARAALLAERRRLTAALRRVNKELTELSRAGATMAS